MQARKLLLRAIAGALCVTAVSAAIRSAERDGKAVRRIERV